MSIKKACDKIKGIFELSFSLAKANFKLRNEGSYLGLLWYILNPLLLFLILMSVFGNNIGTGIEFYPLYLLLGLIIFNFFSGATSESTRTIINNAGFIKSIKLNYSVLVLSAVLQFIFSHVFEVIVFAGFLLYYNVSPVLLLFYPVILIFFCLFVLGVSFVLASLGVYINDLDNVWRVFTTLLWFLSPIFYSVDIGGFSMNFNSFNPLFYFMTLSRDIIIYHSMPQKWIIVGALFFSFAVFIFGFLVFNKLKNKFAERV